MVSVGQRLYEERTKRGLSIEEVAKSTKIRPLFITAIEKGDYLRLPSSAYAIGFVKNYVSFLGLPSKELLAKFRREFDEREFRKVLPESFTSEKKIATRTFRIRRFIPILICIIILILGYLLFQYRFVFLSPFVHIDFPPEHATVTSDVVAVQGITDSNVSLTVNGNPAFVDSNGHFKKEITVFSGKTVITIQAVNSFGKKSTVERHIIVKGE